MPRTHPTSLDDRPIEARTTTVVINIWRIGGFVAKCLDVVMHVSRHACHMLAGRRRRPNSPNAEGGMPDRVWTGTEFRAPHASSIDSDRQGPSQAWDCAGFIRNVGQISMGPTTRSWETSCRRRAWCRRACPQTRPPSPTPPILRRPPPRVRRPSRRPDRRARPRTAAP